jgi:hypothetical protein
LHFIFNALHFLQYGLSNRWTMNLFWNMNTGLGPQSMKPSSDLMCFVFNPMELGTAAHDWHAN